MAPPPISTISRATGLTEQERAGEVGGQCLVPLVQGDLQHLGRERHAGAVHEDVDTPQLLYRRGRGRRDGGWVAEVDGRDVESRASRSLRAARASGLRPSATTVAPSPRKRSTIAAPIPPVAPVTMTFLPSKRAMRPSSFAAGNPTGRPGRDETARLCGCRAAHPRPVASTWLKVKRCTPAMRRSSSSARAATAPASEVGS